jgi:trk system potassium uptake protein TrkA
MYVLIVGCGRVGSAIAKRMIRHGHEVSVLDENPEAHALLEHDMDQTWEDAGGRFTVGTALEVEALHEAGIDRADVVVCSTDGDNTNIIVAQLAKKRFQVPKVVVRVLDPYRAEWYHQQGIHTVCPTQVAIDMLTDAVIGEPETVAGGAG